MDADDSYWTEDESVTVGFNSDNLFRWYMNSVSMVVEWDDPSLLQVYNNATSWSDTSGVVELPTPNEWAYVIVETDNAVPHPLHMHGHDFFILAQGSGSYSSSADLSTTNPPRRDVAMLPASGYLVLAFKTDNPGAWLMHCHIGKLCRPYKSKQVAKQPKGWHTSEGFAIQFIERESELYDLIDYESLESNCKAWGTYVSDDDIVEDDSGI